MSKHAPRTPWKSLRALTDRSAAEELAGALFSWDGTTASGRGTAGLDTTNWYTLLKDMRQSIVAELQATTPAEQSFELLLTADDALDGIFLTLNSSLQQQAERLTQERDHFESLYAVTHEIATNLDLDGVARSALDGAIKTTGADVGLLLIIDRESERLFSWASTGWEVSPIEPENLPDDWTQGWRDEPISPIEDIAALPQAEWRTALQVPPTVSALIIAPIVTNGEFYGLLALGSQQSNHFTIDDASIVKAIATFQVEIAAG